MRLLVESYTMGDMPVMLVGVPVGAPPHVGRYRNPSVASGARDAAPARTLPVALMTSELCGADGSITKPRRPVSASRMTNELSTPAPVASMARSQLKLDVPSRARRR